MYWWRGHIVCIALLTWRLTETLEGRLRSVHRGMERKVLSVTWRENKRASWIKLQIRVDDIVMTSKNKKWIQAAHIMGITDYKGIKYQSGS